MTNTRYSTVGIIPGPHPHKAVLERLDKLLGANKVTMLLIPKDDYDKSQTEKFARQADIFCCIGGDGTMLKAIGQFFQYQKPFTGINLGHTGFLVDLSPDDIDPVFLKLLNGEVYEEKRMLLHARIIRAGKQIIDFYAANEVYLRNSGGAMMSYLDVIINGHPVHTEMGDGLLISTPTGSTAYNLSNGGPILFPSIPAICLTPICPNYLNSRPVVIGSEAEIQVHVPTYSLSRKVTIEIGGDGRCRRELKPGDRVLVKKHNVEWRLLHPNDYEYFNLLRSKLKWGIGPQHNMDYSE